MAVPPGRLDFLRVKGSGGFQDDCKTRTHGVPLILSTFNWVSSKLIHQSQPSEYTGANDEDRDETPEDSLFSLSEFLSFSVGVYGR